MIEAVTHQQQVGSKLSNVLAKCGKPSQQSDGSDNTGSE